MSLPTMGKLVNQLLHELALAEMDLEDTDAVRYKLALAKVVTLAQLAVSPHDGADAPHGKTPVEVALIELGRTAHAWDASLLDPADDRRAHEREQWTAYRAACQRIVQLARRVPAAKRTGGRS